VTPTRPSRHTILSSISAAFLLQHCPITATMAPHACVQCLGPANERCAGCLGAPGYGKSKPDDTFYCGPMCQKAHWDKHKPECKMLQDRITLHRAASLLQALMYRICMQASYMSFTGVRVEGNTIHLHQYNGFLSRTPNMQPLVVGSDVAQDAVEAISVHLASEKAVIFLHDFAKELLSSRALPPHPSFELTDANPCDRALFQNGRR
jgi:hypothetical protein